MSVDLLIDTQDVIWLAASDERVAWLEPHLTERASTVTISSVSLAEIAIKQSIGKLVADVADIRRQSRRAGLLELAWSGDHVEALAELPLHHKDPFDRMLIAQARSEGMTIVTSDAEFARYDVPRLAP